MRTSGIWAAMMDGLVNQVRMKAICKESLTYTIIDSQNVIAIYASKDCGIDGGKTKERKLYIAVDAVRNLLFVKVHATNIYDTVSGGNVLPCFGEIFIYSECVRRCRISQNL